MIVFSEMELSSSNMKKILIFSQREVFLIFSQKKDFLIFPKMEPSHFSAQALKIKELHLGKRKSRKNFIFNFLHQNFFPSEFFSTDLLHRNQKKFLHHQ